ncbi:MAG: lytic murein transglycosylase B [Gammaproteobacteria bacterium]|nr:lytic murein transglycosylase B [Gammaproteobacteria bacterium]
MKSLASLTFFCHFFVLSAAMALDIERPDIQQFIAETYELTQLSREQLSELLGQAEIQPRIIELMTKPAEKTKPWHEYREIFLTSERIQGGSAFMRTHAAELAAVEQKTGVPASIITAIIGVETYYGRLTGGFRVLDALATLGFDYPPRGKFFRRELAEFLQLVEEQDIDPLTAKGSYAGAMGAAQFIPSSYRAYARSGDNDQKIDLWQSWPDVFASIANYFVAHGWQRDRMIMVRAELTAGADLKLANERPNLDLSHRELRQAGWQARLDLADDTQIVPLAYQQPDSREYWLGLNNFYTITRYNRSRLYARAVIELAQAVEEDFRTQSKLATSQ